MAEQGYVSCGRLPLHLGQVIEDYRCGEGYKETYVQSGGVEGRFH